MLTLKLLLKLETMCRRWAYKLQMKRVQVASRMIRKLELSIQTIDEKAVIAKEKVREQIDMIKKLQ